MQPIHVQSDINQWSYVLSKLNPANDVSYDQMQVRTHLPLSNLQDQNFYWLNKTSCPFERTEAITAEDPEIKNLVILNRIAKSDGLQNFWLEQTEDNSQSDLVQAKPTKDY